MRTVSHIVLWIHWVLFLIFVGASLLIILSGPDLDDGKPDAQLRTAYLTVATVTGSLGIGTWWGRKRFFLTSSRLNVGTSKGLILYLFLSVGILLLGFTAFVSLYLPYLLWGELVMPSVGFLVGVAFLVLGFPRIPRVMSSAENR